MKNFIALIFMLTITVTPNGYCQESGNNQKDDYTLTFANISVTVSRNGGRIISFKCAGKEMLTNSDVHAEYFGGTLWISPQSGNWPEPVEIDSDPYEVNADGDKLVMTSKPDKKNGLVARKEYYLSQIDTSLVLRYTLENTSSTPVSFAPWDVVRTPPGISFFPAGETADINRLVVDSSYIENDVVWCPSITVTPRRGQKISYLAKEGWLAHYVNNLLFIKRFPDITPEEVPRGQGEVEIYLAPGSIYTELENHGRYTSLAKGDTIVYNQKWIMRDIGKVEQKELYNIAQKIVKNISFTE